MTRRMYHLYLCNDINFLNGRKSFKNIEEFLSCKIHIKIPIENIKAPYTLEEIDSFTTLVKNARELEKKFNINTKDHNAIILSYPKTKDNVIPKKVTKYDVLYEEDKNFITSYNNKNYCTHLTDSLSKYLSNEPKEILRSPIGYYISERIKTKYDSNDIDIGMIKNEQLYFYINKYYENNTNYRNMRNLYLYLKTKNALEELKKEEDKTKRTRQAQYYLYAKKEYFKEHKDDFFYDKILLFSSTLQNIDTYTSNFNTVNDIVKELFPVESNYISCNEGIIISGTTKNILEKKEDREPIFHPILLNEDKELIEMQKNNDKKDEYNRTIIDNCICHIDDKRREYYYKYGEEYNSPILVRDLLKLRNSNHTYKDIRVTYFLLKDLETQRKQKNKQRRINL